jgi:uncharacterized protein YdaU (DUF1376 family)
MEIVMSTKTDIWMPIFIGDYLSATSRLTTQQHGAYFLLLMDYWKNGRPPDDDEVLAQITKMTPDAWSNARRILLAYFQIENGHWVQKRIEKELIDSKTRKETAVAKAKAGATARWKKDNNAPSNAQAMLDPMLDPMLENASSPSPSPSSLSLPLTSNKTTKNIYSTDFEEFWLDYPKREGKSSAYKEWKKIAPDKELQEKIVSGLLEYRKSRKVKDGFIKDCVNWLKGKHWEDEILNVEPIYQNKSAPVTFAERDEINRRKRWEEMTGQQWPDNQPTIEAPIFLGIEQ